VKASNNYLAIRNLTGHYFINGNWRIDFADDYEVGNVAKHFFPPK
jgi:papilin